jgi:hypothetical protein
VWFTMSILWKLETVSNLCYLKITQ